MKKVIALFLLVISINVYAQETEPKEIENSLFAVRNANPGDYILLPSGRRYILSREEIAIVRNEFDYSDLSGVEMTVNEDGTEVYHISQGHTAYVFPDGQSVHILKTSISFTSFMRHIQQNFHINYYISYFGDYYEYVTIEDPDFSVFRASVQFFIISDGIHEMQAVDITVYNYEGENRIIKYTSEPDIVWGNIREAGAYTPVGETRPIDFEIE